MTSALQSFFSIIADEATDVSNKEQMMVYIRWVDEDFSVHEDSTSQKLTQTCLPVH